MIELKRLKLINWHNFENVSYKHLTLPTKRIGENSHASVQSKKTHK